MTDDAQRRRRPIRKLHRVGRASGPRSCSRTPIHWCDGSDAEVRRAVPPPRRSRAPSRRSTPTKRPNSFYARSDPGDVARVEDRTFICSEHEDDAGPTNNWRDPAEMRAEMLRALHGRDARPHDVRRAVLDGSARLADRAHRRRAHRLRVRRRQHAHDDAHGHGRARRARRRRRVRAVRALGRHAARARPGRRAVAVQQRRTSTSSTSRRRARSSRTAPGYGGNALLGKKCFALRIASVMARDEGWLAEHMLILKLTNPQGDVRYVAAAFPSRVRQDQPRDARADAAGLEGRDDRRRHLLDEVRRRRPPVRDQPRVRDVRRRARHRRRHEPERGRARSRATPCSRTSRVTDDGDVWWEGLTDEPPEHCTDWRGNDWTPGVRHARRAPEQPLHRAAVAGAVDRAGVGRPGGRPDLGDPLRRPPRRRRCRSSPRRTTGATACSSARSWARRRPRRRPARSATCAATRSRCCRSAATTWATTSRTGCDIGEATDADEAAEAVLRELVPQGRRAASSCGPGYGENSRVLAWIVRALRRRGRGGRHADRPAADAPSRCRPTASTSPTTRSPSCCRSTRTRGGPSCRSSRSTTRRSATACRRRCATSSRRSTNGWTDLLVR